MFIKSKPKLYIHVGEAKHFLRWEIPEFKKYFTVVNAPSDKAVLLSFGPDVLEEAATLPALLRFAVLFPGFSKNPVYNLDLRKKQTELIRNFYTEIFINKGALEIAYKKLSNVSLYPFSVDTGLIKFKRYRTEIESLVHISSNSPQKDWERSEKIMELTGLKHEVYPPRVHEEYIAARTRAAATTLVRLNKKKAEPPFGYLSHEMIVKKYSEYDGFVHVARDIKSKLYFDGKYTATLIEAGMTGCLLFWHDTFKLGNNLETVFSLPLDEKKAADEILNIRQSINVLEHSKKTRQEMLDTFNPQVSVKVRADHIRKYLD